MQAEAIRELLDKHAPHTIGNLQSRVEQVLTNGVTLVDSQTKAPSGTAAPLVSEPAEQVDAPLMETMEQKNERNSRVQGRYDELMHEGRRGHYETMFRIVREEVSSAVLADRRQRAAEQPESQQPDSFHQTSASGVCTVQTALPWVPVSERLPALGEEVLVYAPNDKFRQVAFDEWRELRECPVDFSTVSVVVGEGWQEYEFEEVTHWMPLPAPPMNGADNDSPRSDRPDLAAPAVLPLLPEDREAP